MRCLNDMLGDDRMRGWTIKGIEEGCLITNEAIFRAVAKCPLKASAKRTWFDADEFFNIALRDIQRNGIRRQGIRLIQSRKCPLYRNLSSRLYWPYSLSLSGGESIAR
jgi:hypothetical protein